MDEAYRAFKAKMMAKYEKELEAVYKKKLLTLSEMEEAVSQAKVEIGRELLEEVVALKKTANLKNTEPHVRSAKSQ